MKDRGKKMKQGYRQFILASLFIALAMNSTACNKKNRENTDVEAVATQPTAQLPIDTSTIGTDDEVIMIGGDIRVTLGDYAHCISLHRFNGRYFSKRALANPRFQHDEAQRCFQIQMLRDYVRKNQLTTTDEMRHDAIAKALKKAEVESLPLLARKIGVEESEIAELANDSLLQSLVQRDLISRLEPAKAKALYDVDARQYTIDLIDFPNEPSDEEVAAYAEDHQENINKFISAQPRVLLSPPKVEFVRFTFPKTGESEDAATLQNAENLRLTAIRGGLDAAEKSCTQAAQQGCTLLNDDNNRLIQEYNEDNTWAFRMPVGSVSNVIHSPVAYEILISQKITPPERYDITHPDVKQMLARKAMISETASPSLLAKLKPALEAPNPDLPQIAKENNGRYRHFDAIAFHRLSDEKQIESPLVLTILGEMKPTESRLFSNPIVDNGRVYVFYVSQMSIPDEQDFHTNGAQWLERKASDSNAALVNQWLQAHIPTMSTLNIKPLESEYGILQPDGSIR